MNQRQRKKQQQKELARQQQGFMDFLGVDLKKDTGKPNKKETVKPDKQYEKPEKFSVQNSRKKEWLSKEGYYLEHPTDIHSLSNSKLSKLSYPPTKSELDKIGFRKFNYTKNHKTPEGQGLYIAYKDFTNESTLNQHIKEFSKYSDDELIGFLKSIVEQPPTRHKAKKGESTGSSGKAGTVNIFSGNTEYLKMLHKELKNQDKKISKNKKKKLKESDKTTEHREHTKNYKGYQVLGNSQSMPYIENLTPHKALVIGNALMHNITELDRDSFYNSYYREVCKIIPNMSYILPNPRIKGK